MQTLLWEKYINQNNKTGAAVEKLIKINSLCLATNVDPSEQPSGRC